MSQQSITQISTDIVQVQLPLPFALRIVNVYLLRDGDGWAVIDTGIHTQDAEAVWRAAWAEMGISPAAITQIILTHGHPDHFGMAGWLQQQAQAAGGHLPAVRLSPRERQFVHVAWEHPAPDYAPKISAEMTWGGLPLDALAPVVDGIAATRSMTYPHPLDLTLLYPGETLTVGARTFEIIAAPGHNDGQIIFYDPADQLMLCGDHVLTKITPNIGMWPETDPEPLRRFMESLRALLAYDVRLALPGHRSVIDDWQGRLGELLAHHEARLASCEEVIRTYPKGATVYETALGIFAVNNFTHHEWRFAMMEARAHLDYLVRAERIRQIAAEDRWLFVSL